MFITIITYYSFIFLEYSLHRLGHFRHRYNYIYHLHFKHHKDHYPVGSLLSDSYRSNNEGIIAYVPPILLILGILYTMIDGQIWGQIVIQMGFHTFINDYIHTQIHLKNSWLEKYEWFKKERNLHLEHHLHLQKNLSFGVDHTMDKLNHTFKN
jgi:sterol desaturase/sphingolipid hydroxylase (fatty acid hydroxylase superfamily)